MPIIQPINICEFRRIQGNPDSWDGTFDITLSQSLLDREDKEINLLAWHNNEYKEVLYVNGIIVDAEDTGIPDPYNPGETIINEPQSNFMFSHTDNDGNFEIPQGLDALTDGKIISNAINGASVNFVFKKNQLEAAIPKSNWKDRFTVKEEDDYIIVRLGTTKKGRLSWTVPVWKRTQSYNIGDSVRVKPGGKGAKWFKYTCQQPNNQGKPPSTNPQYWAGGVEEITEQADLNTIRINNTFIQFSSYFGNFGALLPNSKLNINSIVRKGGDSYLVIIDPLLEFSVEKCKPPGEDNPRPFFLAKYPLNKYKISDADNSYGNAIIIRIGTYSFNGLFEWSLDCNPDWDDTLKFFTPFYQSIDAAFKTNSITNLPNCFYGVPNVQQISKNNRYSYTLTKNVENWIVNALRTYVNDKLKYLQVNSFDIDDDTKEIWIDLIKNFSRDNQYDETVTYKICLDYIGAYETFITSGAELIDELNKGDYAGKTRGTTAETLINQRVIYDIPGIVDTE